ncbi:MAG TPA: SEC-C metal-binding domain-containing protein [Casimicrobiaceae bacterium]|nr:SEC-C metal-binding domain-containing protein [Casimicrobiaceae bacterium]
MLVAEDEKQIRLRPSVASRDDVLLRQTQGHVSLRRNLPSGRLSLEARFPLGSSAPDPEKMESAPGTDECSTEASCVNNYETPTLTAGVQQRHPCAVRHGALHPQLWMTCCAPCGKIELPSFLQQVFRSPDRPRPEQVEPRSEMTTPSASRNDPCPCGSGKRYKACHGALASVNTAPAPEAAAADQYAGLPVLTCAGDSLVSRIAGSQLRAVGLPELVARDLADYEARALRFARNPKELSTIRTRLAVNRSNQPLFDMARYARDFEDRLLQIAHEQSQRG